MPGRPPSASIRISANSGLWPKTSAQYRPDTLSANTPVSISAAGFSVATRPSRSSVTMPLDDRGEDVVGVALELGDFLEALAQLGVGGLEGGALAPQLPGHVVERERELAELVRARGRDPLVELAPGHGLGAGGELPHRARDPAGDERGAEPADEQGQHGQQHELPARLGDLRLHPPPRQPDAHRAPALRPRRARARRCRRSPRPCAGAPTPGSARRSRAPPARGADRPAPTRRARGAGCGRRPCRLRRGPSRRRCRPLAPPGSRSARAR